MGLFVKKVNEDEATDFFRQTYKNVLEACTNGDNKERLEGLRSVAPMFKAITLKDFNDNYSAAYIGSLGVAWQTYTFSRGISVVDTLEQNRDRWELLSKEMPKLRRLSDLIDEYADSYGRAYQEGRPADQVWAEVFFENVVGEDAYIWAEAAPNGYQEVIDALRYVFATFNDSNVAAFKPALGRDAADRMGRALWD